MNDNKYCVKHIGFIPPPYGGVSVYIKRLVEQLTIDGFPSGAYYLDSDIDAFYIESALFHKWHWLNTRFFFKRFQSLKNEVKSFRIIHSHLSLESAIFLWGLNVFCNKEIVVTVHNSMVDNYYQKTNFINKIFLFLLAKRNIFWIAVSQQAKLEMEKLPICFKNKIQIIPAYIPSNITNKTSLPKSLEQFIEDSEKIITFYGHSFMKNCGNDIYGFFDAIEMYSSLVKQYKTCARLVYCIADMNDEKELSKIRLLASELNISDKIYWQIGPLENMHALWNHTDVYIRPTSTDGDSVAIREALDLGLNVVASDVCMRPDGVLVYNYNHNIDFVTKVNDALKLERKGINMNYTYYDNILDIYKSILKKGDL